MDRPEQDLFHIYEPGRKSPIGSVYAFSAADALDQWAIDGGYPDWEAAAADGGECEARRPEWPDPMEEGVSESQITAALKKIAPCRCCGFHCASQLEFVETNGGNPWPMCAGCDPGLDEHRSEICECRRARGDANWVRSTDPWPSGDARVW